jgi:N-glycosylase/DNA lyase
LERLFKVYSYTLNVNVHPATLQAYTLPWQFDGRRAYVPLCGTSIASLEQKAGEINVTVYATPSEKCWENLIDRWKPVVDSSLLNEYYSRTIGDPLLKCVGHKLRGLSVRLSSIWSAAIVAVCQQNASFLQGWRMVFNVYKLLGRKVVLVHEGAKRLYLLPPEPSQVSEEKLRLAGLGYRARTLEAIARRVAANPDIPATSLAGLKGVGSYTLGLIQLLAEAKLDATIVDRWVKGLAAHAYNVSEREAERVWLSRWRPWQGVASYHLTIVFDAEPLSRSLKRLQRGDVCPHLDTSKPTPLTLWRTATSWS